MLHPPRQKRWATKARYSIMQAGAGGAGGAGGGTIAPGQRGAAIAADGKRRCETHDPRQRAAPHYRPVIARNLRKQSGQPDNPPGPRQPVDD